MTLINSIAAIKDEIAAYRRELHQNPQTSYEETFASDLVAKKLTEWGIPFKSGIAVTGIVATIEGQRTDSGKRIGLRADMDALNMTETSGQPWASKNEGKMHGCGHDGHTAMLLGAAKYLSETRNFNGTVHLIFQPAEEGGAGAIRMIEQGLFKDFPMNAVFGMHNWPGIPKGKAAMRSGPIMASSDDFKITLTGRGGHAAMPHMCIDPVLAGAQIVTALQSIVSRGLNATDQGVVSVTNFKAGSGATNVIPETAFLSGTFRAFRIETRNFLKQRIQEIATSVAAAMQVKAEVSYRDGYDPTINTADETAFCADVMKSMLGADNVDTDVAPCMGAEDFGAMLREVSGCYIMMGQGEPDKANSPHNKSLHDTGYDFNDEIIPTGIEYWARITEAAMPLDR